jgi:hypothetical protein
MPITPTKAKRERTGCIEYPANEGDGDVVEGVVERIAHCGLESLERYHKRFQKYTCVSRCSFFFIHVLGRRVTS